MLSFGQRLKFIRKEAEMTQNELAEQLMVSVQAVSKWECDNTMPDISQIVPLAAIFGVTTDWLLGAGTDEETDTEKLKNSLEEVFKKYKPYTYEDNVFRKSFELCREHIKKYPLDYSTKLLCAMYMFYFLEYGVGGNCFAIPKDQEEALYNEALRHLTSLINYDRDTERIIRAKIFLIGMYLYKENFSKAEEMAEELPIEGNIRYKMLIEVYSKKNDHDKCVELSNKIAIEATVEYLHGLSIRARRISILGNARKKEAIALWSEYEEAAKLNHRIFKADFTMICVADALKKLSNDYIAISEFDKAFEKIEELTDYLIVFYKGYYDNFKDKAYSEEIEKMKDFCRSSLINCYDWCFPTSDNIIANDPRYKACEAKIAAALK